MGQKFIIIGAGGFSRDIIDIFDACRDAGQDCDFVGYLVDAQYGQPGTVVNGKPILGDIRWLINHASEVKVICGIGDPTIRKRLIRYAQEYSARFGNIIHPTAVLTKHIHLGEGIVIGAGSIAAYQTTIGNHVHINLDCTIGHDVTLKDFATLAPGVHVSGNVTLGEGCYIGTGANIIEKKVIGDWSIVGAGSVVISDVPSYSTVVGVPGKVIKTRKST